MSAQKRQMNALKAAALALVTLVGPVAALGWALSFKNAATQSARSAASVRVEAAQELIDLELEQGAAMMSQVASLVANDARAKASLSTLPVDKATVRDSLGELQGESHFDYFALCAASGEVIASAAEQGLDIDAQKLKELRGSPWFKNALDGAAAATPVFVRGRFLIVSAAPVVRGSTLVGMVVVGKAVEKTSFEKAAKVTGGSVGVKAKNDDWFGSQPSAPSGEVVGRASRAWPEVVIVSTRPGALPIEGLWAPLLIIGVVALAALAAMLTVLKSKAAHAAS